MPKVADFTHERPSSEMYADPAPPPSAPLPTAISSELVAETAQIVELPRPFSPTTLSQVHEVGSTTVVVEVAIVVGVATTALALTIIVRIREEYGTIEEDELDEINRER